MGRDLKCPKSFWDGTMGDNQRAIWLWKATWWRKEIPVGTELILPLEQQRYVFAKVMTWGRRKPDSKRREATYTFESHCVVCRSPFSFRVPSYFSNVVRTCPKHRRQWRTKEAKPRERKVRDNTSGVGKIQNAALNAWYLAKADGDQSTDAIVKHTLAELVHEKSTSTRGNIVRAYRQMQKRRLIPEDGADLL